METPISQSEDLQLQNDNNLQEKVSELTDLVKVLVHKNQLKLNMDPLSENIKVSEFEILQEPDDNAFKQY